MSLASLERAGLPVKELFSKGPSTCRRVEALRGGRAVVALGSTQAAVDRAVLPKLEAGQWLRFTRLDDGVVKVSVDLKATLTGESRWSNLFNELSTPRGWRAG